MNNKENLDPIEEKLFYVSGLALGSIWMEKPEQNPLLSLSEEDEELRRVRDDSKE